MTPDQITALDEASAIELGFPHNVYKREWIRTLVYGGLPTKSWGVRKQTEVLTKHLVLERRNVPVAARVLVITDQRRHCCVRRGFDCISVDVFTRGNFLDRSR